MLKTEVFTVPININKLIKDSLSTPFSLYTKALSETIAHSSSPIMKRVSPDCLLHVFNYYL